MKKCSRKFFYADSIQGKYTSPQEIPFKVDIVLEKAVRRKALWEIKGSGFYEEKILYEWEKGDFHFCATPALVSPLSQV